MAPGVLSLISSVPAPGSTFLTDPSRISAVAERSSFIESVGFPGAGTAAGESPA